MVPSGASVGRRTVEGMQIGAHVDSNDPAGAAKERDADVVQFFLGDPQSWKAPTITEVDLEIPFFIHSPYVVNVASANNKIRIPSRKILDQHAKAAAKVGAQGLIVHGGHTTAKDSDTLGLENWVKTFERMERPLPILIENTAGGDHAMARRMDAIARLWDAVGHFDNVGFCLDTCHAHAGGEDLVDVVERVLAITGRIDLVHCNDSRDAFNSGADRHANLGNGEIGADLLVAVVKAAGCPVVVETPSDGQADDIALLKSRVR
jgi:deoxyribonuclease-4